MVKNAVVVLEVLLRDFIVRRGGGVVMEEGGEGLVYTSTCFI